MRPDTLFGRLLQVVRLNQESILVEIIRPPILAATWIIRDAMPQHSPLVVAAAFVFLFNGREIFCVVMMTLGGDRAIITLRAADRDRGSCCDCQKSWEVIAGSDLPSLHSCPFTLRVAECGPWQAVVITCKTCLLQSMIRTNIPG